MIREADQAVGLSRLQKVVVFIHFLKAESSQNKTERGAEHRQERAPQQGKHLLHPFREGETRCAKRGVQMGIECAEHEIDAI